MIFFVGAFSVKSQVTFEHDKKKEMLYVYEEKETEQVLLDSISALQIFTEYSFVASDSIIYVSWSVTTEDGKVYYINAYNFKSKPLSLIEKYWIEESKFKDFFERGLKLELKEDGLSFSKGEISSFVLSYSGLNLKKITETLMKLSKL